MNDRLLAAFKNATRKVNQAEIIFAHMGKNTPSGPVFEVRGRRNYVYVTLRQSIGSQTNPVARNDARVEFSYGLPIKMHLENGTFVIDGVVTREDLAIVPGSPPSGVPVHTHDDRYFTEAEHVTTSTGAPDASKPAKLGADGKWDASLIDTAGIVEDAISGAATDDTIEDASLWARVTGGTLVTTAWSNIKTTLTTLFDTLYAPIAKGVTNGDSHDHIGGDGAPIGTGALVDDAVTFAKMQNIATDSLIGRDTASSGDPENITLNATLSMTGSGALQRAALTGDVTASAGSNATTIANDAVTFAKMQDVATDSVLGRATAGTGDIELITLTAFARTLIDDVAASNARTTLGLGTIATEAETNYLLAAGTRALTGEWDIGEDMAIRAERFEARDSEGLLFEDDGGNDAIFIADGGLVAIGHANAPLKKLHVGVGAGSAILVQGGTTVGETAEILFKMSATDFTAGFIKGAMYFVRSASNARGDIIFALNNVADSSNVSTANAVMALLAGGQAFFGGLTSGGANVLGVKAGTSANDAAVGGVLFVSTTVTNSAASPTSTIGSYTVPANTLAVNNQSIWFEATGIFAANAAAAGVVVFFGGSASIGNISTSTGAGGGTWRIKGRIYRTGATTQRTWVESLYFTSSNGQTVESDTTAETLSSSNILLIQAQTDATASDVVLHTFIVGYSDTNL